MEKIWNSPETSSVNRLPMLNLEHPTAVSLDGTWNFQLIANPDAPLGNWQKLNVPGLWTMVDGQQPFGDKPIYTNAQMPWDHAAPTVPEDNPTGIYERIFTISDNLANASLANPFLVPSLFMEVNKISPAPRCSTSFAQSNKFNSVGTFPPTK